VRSGAIFAAGLLLGLCIAIGLSGRAENWLVVNGVVAHTEGSYCNNRITKGLGYEKVNGSLRLGVGFYDNSNCQWSTYAAAAWLPLYLQSINLRVGGIVGGVTGYRSSVTPAGGIAIASEEQGYGFNVIAIPPLSASSPGVIWLQFKVRLR
jgi:hypothetical protein